MKKILLKTFIFVFRLAIIGGVIMLIPVGYEAWDSFVGYKANTEGYKKYKEKVWSFNFESYKCTGTLKFKPNLLEKKIMYIGSLTANDGLSIDTSNGSLSVDILDKDGFVIGEFTIQNFIQSIDADRVVRLTFDGMLYDPIVIFEEMVNIRVAHTLTIHQPSSSSDSHSGGWEEKASRIKIGMTYQEMVSIAGEPRTKASVELKEQISNDELDYMKYNYGSKWVFFKDNLVYRIR